MPGSISLWFSRPEGIGDKVLFSYGSPVRGGARGLWLVNEGRLCFYFCGHPQDLHVDIPGGVTPDSEPRAVKVPISGVTTLTLEADFGDGFDFGDLCVFAIPRVLRN